MVLVWTASGKPSFCEVKVGFWLQNHLLRGKTKKPKKQSFFRERGGDVEKDGFVFLVLPHKKMVFRKTNFSHVKRWFWSGLPQENHFLRGKSWFLAPKPSFYEVKVGFCVQNHLFTWEKLVLLWKTIFLRGKTKKNNLFQNPLPIL